MKISERDWLFLREVSKYYHTPTFGETYYLKYVYAYEYWLRRAD